MLPAVVLGQYLAGLTGTMCDGPLADFAADDRKTGNRHREAAGALITHRN
jgi:hypothetical protein